MLRYIPSTIFLIIFIFLFLKERRTLALGAFGVLSLVSLWVELNTTILSMATGTDAPAFVKSVVHALTWAITIGIAIYPIALILITFFFGVRMLLKQGMGLWNAAAFILSIVLFLQTFLVPIMAYFGLELSGIYVAVYGYFAAIVVLILYQKALFSLTGILNMFHTTYERKYDLLIVLGTRVQQEADHGIMETRLDMCLKRLKSRPHAEIIVASGNSMFGGSAEEVYCRNYLIGHGVAAEQIRFTGPNRTVRKKLMAVKEVIGDEETGRIAMITSSYNMLRSLLVSRKLKLPCIAYAARTSLYYHWNEMAAEYVLYLRRNRRIEIPLLLLYTVLYWALIWLGWMASQQ